MSHPYSESPYQQPSPFASNMGLGPPPQPRRGGAWKWVLGLALAFGTVLLIVCCGGLFALGKFGLDTVTEEIADQLKDNPVLVEKVGKIESFEMEYGRSLAHDDDDVWMYRVRGTKGEGTVTVRHVTNDDGAEEILSARLRTSDGEFDLLPDKEGNAVLETATPAIPEGVIPEGVTTPPAPE